MRRELVFGLGTIGIGLLFACTQDAERPDLPAVFGRAEPVAVLGPDGTARAALGASCEAVGTFRNEQPTVSLFEDQTQRAFWFQADRPQPLRLTVLAAGDVGPLVGKTVDLGSGPNANYATCSHCFIVAIGCQGSDCSRAALFYPRSGSATFTSVANGPGGVFEGHLDQTELVQVTIDSASNTSTPVANGGCMRAEQVSFKGFLRKSIAAGEENQTGTPPGGPSSSGSTTSSSSSSGNGGSGGGGGKHGKGDSLL